MKKIIHHLRGKGIRSDADKQHDKLRLPGISDNAVFNAEALPDAEPDGRSRKQKVKEKVHSIAEAVKHPQAAIQAHATMQIAVNERPWLENQAKADEDLFDAHDELEAAEAARARAPGDLQGSDRDKLKHAQHRAKQVELDRQELQVAWHMSHFVSRARVVRRRLAVPDRTAYREYDSDGRLQRFKWVKWIGHVCNMLPAAKSQCKRGVDCAPSLSTTPLRMPRSNTSIPITLYHTIVKCSLLPSSDCLSPLAPSSFGGCVSGMCTCGRIRG